MNRRRFTVAATIAAAGGALALGGYLGRRGSHPRHVSLADISLPDTTQTLRHGGEWLGKVVVVNHWATWCPPCREEIPLLIDYQSHRRAAGLQIIGIAHDMLATTRAYGDTIGINYPSLVAVTGGAELLRAHGNHEGALPFTAFFDRRGNLVSGNLGLLTAAQLRRAVEPLL